MGIFTLTIKQKGENTDNGSAITGKRSEERGIKKMSAEKFVEFFKQWRKGDLHLKDGGCYEGVVEEFLPARKLENSIVIFTCLKKNGEQLKPLTEENVSLKEVDYFEATDGPIFNIQKYLSINGLEKQKDMVCVVLGLEFYAPKKTANLLKADVKELLFANLKEVPLLLVQDQPPVQLTPTISSWMGRVKSLLFQRRKG